MNTYIHHTYNIHTYIIQVIHIYIHHTYVHTYTHTYIHTYIYIPIQTLLAFNTLMQGLLRHPKINIAIFEVKLLDLTVYVQLFCLTQGSLRLAPININRLHSVAWQPKPQLAIP